MSWIEIPIDDYHKKLAALPAEHRGVLDGWSPGHVAARLQVSRSALHQAVKRGALKGYRLTREGKMVALIIPEQSVRDYENSDTRAKFTPKIYRTA